MCGIFGFITTAKSEINPADYQSVIRRLFALSESRGKDASGLMIVSNDDITVLKRPIRAKLLVNSKEYQEIFKSFSYKSNKPKTSITFLGHARMVTNGSEDYHDNNQPVVYPNAVVLHNGIVVNDNQLWHNYPQLKRNYQVDTEIIVALFQYFRDIGADYNEAFKLSFTSIKGANSVALIPVDNSTLFLGSSNGSLYFSIGKNNNELLFASEFDFLNQVKKHRKLIHLFNNSIIQQITAGESYAINIDQLDITKIKNNQSNTQITTSIKKRKMIDVQPQVDVKSWKTPLLLPDYFTENERYFTKVRDSISSLRRCTKCILPETFPNIEFDEQGLCNYCRSYSPVLIKGEENLKNIISAYDQMGPNCLVPMSGGRDSCYSLHYIKTELGLNPIAYTYDWGMVTDLARRNISRLCGSLGIEHILVSADLKTKRSNIRKNVLAWLKKPALGMIPLFMAGDKHYYYYAYKIKKSYNLHEIFMGENHYEKTLFKTAFSGAHQTRKSYMAYQINAINKSRMAAYYCNQFASNHGYINRSIIDTFSAFVSYYFIPHKYINLYDYISWDEEIVSTTIIKQYDWECAKDTKTTWRIGDGTSPFYNYIYLNIAGFTENDTFRSNQIRAGVLTRDEALQLANRDNEPLYDSIKWYCDTINIDMIYALTQINNTKKLYE